MLVQIITNALTWLETQAYAIPVVMAIVEYVKLLIKDKPWYEKFKWTMTVFGFALGFVGAVPTTGFVGFVGLDWAQYVANSIMLGLVATGVYKTLASLIKKATLSVEIDGEETTIEQG
jgi:hypothetical protein